MENKLQKFVILSIPRTGTNWLIDIINQSPEMYCYGEIFQNEDEMVNKYLLEKKSDGKLLKNLDTFLPNNLGSELNPSLIRQLYYQILDKLSFARIYDSKVKYIGFKLFNTHSEIKYREQRIYANTDVIKIIVSRNLLDSYISNQFALKYNSWSHKIINEKIMIDINDFRKYLQNIETYYDNIFANLSGTVIILDYDDIHKRQSISEKINYIKSKLEPTMILTWNKIKERFIKQNLISKHRDQIFNYDEVEDFLKSQKMISLLQNN